MGRDLELDDETRQLERLYREFATRVRWVVRARGVSEASLDDAVHDVFLRIHRRLAQRDPELAVSAWVDGIARNVAFTHRRTAARRAHRDAQVPEPEAPRTPHEELQRRDAWHRLRRFLDDLEEEQREAFILCEVLQTPAPEVARSTRVKLNTIYSRVRLARRRFDKAFGDAKEAELSVAVRQEAPSEHQQRRALAALLVEVGSAPGAAALTGVGVASAWKISAAAAVVAIAGLGVVRVATEPEPSANVAAPAQSSQRSHPAAEATPTGTVRAAMDPAPPSEPTEPTEPQAATPVPPRPHSRQQSGAPSNPEPDAATDPLTAEVELLERARGALGGGDHAKALRWVDAHRAKFPEGSLSAQRHGIERAAACRAGDEDRAQKAARALGSANPKDACKKTESPKKVVTEAQPSGAE